MNGQLDPIFQMALNSFFRSSPTANHMIDEVGPPIIPDREYGEFWADLMED